jgi:hypothetical protein
MRILKVDSDIWQVTNINWNFQFNTFSGTLTGMTAATSGSISYQYSTDGIVTLSRDESLADLTGTSNATTMTLTGIPAALRPKFSSARAICYGVIDNGVVLPAVVSISATGVATFSIAANPPAAFTAAGTKGLQSGWQLSYRQ